MISRNIFIPFYLFTCSHEELDEDHESHGNEDDEAGQHEEGTREGGETRVIDQTIQWVRDEWNQCTR